MPAKGERGWLKWAQTNRLLLDAGPAPRPRVNAPLEQEVVFASQTLQSPQSSCSRPGQVLPWKAAASRRCRPTLSPAPNTLASTPAISVWTLKSAFRPVFSSHCLVSIFPPPFYSPVVRFPSLIRCAPHPATSCVQRSSQHDELADTLS